MERGKALIAKAASLPESFGMASIFVDRAASARQSARRAKRMRSQARRTAGGERARTRENERETRENYGVMPGRAPAAGAETGAVVGAPAPGKYLSSRACAIASVCASGLPE